MNKKPTAVLTVLAIMLGAVAAYASYKSKISKDIYFSPDILKDQNPFSIEKKINQCTILKGTVRDFIYSDDATLLKAEGTSSVWRFYAYLPKDQLENLRLDQEVAVKGIFKTKLAESFGEGAEIYIGERTNNPFYSTKAKIIGA